MNYFELVMLICFSVGWPFSIYKSYTSKSNKEKSLLYMIIILLGYLCGVGYKLTGPLDNLIWLYLMNALLVLIDINIYTKNKYQKG